jgi:hypothetical protein
MKGHSTKLRPDGGRIAARGFQYQYLRTLEYLITHVDDPQLASVRVEGPPPTNDSVVDAIDFDVLDADGSCLLAAQVKSKAPGGSFSTSEAFGALTKLVSAADALSYCLFTNAEPTAGAQELAYILSLNCEPTQLTDQLATLLSDAPARLSQLKALSIIEVERLARCSVLFDDRDDIEIREALRESLRIYRNRNRSGLGQRSAGLLTGYLVSEVLRRAADIGQATFTVSQLRSHLLVADDELARVTGARDWGVVVGSIPPVPDVDRPELLSALVRALTGRRVNNVLRAALVGPSGIGKSSLAASYIADRADSYDWIFWIDGETEESILTSFRHIAAFLSIGEADVNYHASSVYLRRSVHTELSRLAGQWLIVFDNITDLRQADAWMPHAGSGHVVVTSIDSTGRHGTATVIDVGVMKQSQAIELLCRRLSVGGDDRERYGQELGRLAQELSYWPLALELASGYMDTCGIRLAHVDNYLRALKIRSLADTDSLPPIYPRTLVSAVSLCLERLVTSIDRDGQDGIHPYLALKIMQNAAFLASRQLPCHMIAAPAVFDPRPEMGPGRWVVPPSTANMGEVIRELRRFSLVSSDRDLPEMGNPVIDEDRTITINTIVQEIVRIEIERSNDVRESLNLLANHVERWLTASLELNFLERASALLPHAEMLANHMRRLGVIGRDAALLYGNLAGAYRARGDASKVVEFLYAELEIAQSLDAEDILTVQAKLALLDFYFDTLTVTFISFEEAVSYLEDVARSVVGICSTFPEAAMKLTLDVKNFLNRPEVRAIDSPQLAAIEGKFDEIASKIGPTEYSESMLAIRKASELIGKGRVGTAERLCTRALGSGSITGTAELEARRLLVESLVWQGKWQEAQRAHVDYRQHFGSSSLHIRTVIQYVHNVGYACSILIMAQGATEATSILSDLVGWPLVSSVIENPATGSESRLCLLVVIQDVIHGDYDLAQEKLRRLRPADFSEGTAEETKGWCVLWQLTWLAAFRGMSQSYNASAH